MLLLTAKCSRPPSDWEALYERRFREPFKEPIILFGSMVECHPISAKDQSRHHQFGKKVLPGICLGYALHADRIWRGDILVADIEELENFGPIRNSCSKTQVEREEITFIVITLSQELSSRCPVVIPITTAIHRRDQENR